jgi:hypothetical protein
MSSTLSSPELTALEPDTATTIDGQFVLGIRGIGFTMDSQVFYDGEGQATGMLGQDLLSASFDPAWWNGEPVTIEVTVRTGEHETEALEFILTEPEELEDVEPESIGQP